MTKHLSKLLSFFIFLSGQMDRLSIELVETILDYCCESDYPTLAVVCKRLYSVVNHRYLYRKVRVLYPRKYHCLLETQRVRPDLFLHVQTLDLSGYTTCGARLTAIQRQQMALNHDNLERLLWNCKHLQEIDMNNEVCDAFTSIDVLRCLLYHHPQLRKLSMSAVSLERLKDALTDIVHDGMATWLGPTQLAQLTFMSHVDLNHIPVFPRFLELLVANNHAHLTQLCLSKVQISQAMLEALDPLRLTHLTLEHCIVPDESLLSFLQRCTRLKVLNIQTSPVYSQMGCYQMARLARIPFTQLEELNIMGRGQHMDDETLTQFCTSTLSTIKILKMDVSREITLDGLAHILKQTKALKSIHLSFWQNDRCWMWYTCLMQLLEKSYMLETVHMTSRLTHSFPKTVGHWLIHIATPDTFTWRRYLETLTRSR
ncbi:hypothetical protein EC973_006355 [Apophysomyces ossiformis]|uniref:F-box domain-containing protein n=1 Tax=Apophysomyces ossiformis TaxID=679940 RepID=A0A8H7BYZ7_9FUNG|nr:hypothetical protein EC973_006355 [Apophysomyces ossiformis]